MVTINSSELRSLREKFKDKKIVYVGGVFDLTHAGHIIFFEECKQLGDILVVLIARDSFIKDYKGDDRPILNEHIRLKTVDSFKPVDFTLLDPTMKFTKEDGHLKGLKFILEELRPDIYVVNEDILDYDDRKKLVGQFETKMYISKRDSPVELEKISTSKIIEKIKNLK